MSICKPLHRVFISAVVFLAASAPTRAVVNGIPAPCNDRRFDCVGVFFAAGATPGSCGGGVSGCCVLIAPDQILIKRHSLNLSTTQPLSALGNNRFRARFRRTADGDSQNSVLDSTGNPCHGVYQEALVSRFVDPPLTGSDTVLAYLDHPIVNIRPAPLDIDSNFQAGTEIVLVGWGYAGECFGSGEHWTLRYSRGLLPYGATGDSFSYTPCGISSVAPCLTCPAGGPWVAANYHDSGAGIFVETPSGIPGDPTPELRLIGAVSTTLTAHRVSIFNHAGGQPPLEQTPPLTQGAISDFNRDGNVDQSDFFAFIDAYFANRCDANVTANQTKGADDIFAFLSAFFTKR